MSFHGDESRRERQTSFLGQERLKTLRKKKRPGRTDGESEPGLATEDRNLEKKSFSISWRREWANNLS